MTKLSYKGMRWCGDSCDLLTAGIVASQIYDTNWSDPFWFADNAKLERNVME
jgi:hypothetical protein